MKKIIKIIVFALTISAAFAGVAFLLKKYAERISDESDEDAMFIG